MRVRLLDEDYRRVVLAFWVLARHDEAVEATPLSHREAPVSSPEQRKIKTCPACGSTGTIGGTFYESSPTYCKPCTTSKINAHINKVNELTRTTAEHHREPWSELDVEMLLGAVAEGMSGQDIAELLGRTYLSVHGKLGAIRKLIDEGRAVEYVYYENRHGADTAHVVRRMPEVCDTCHLQKPCFCE